MTDFAGQAVPRLSPRLALLLRSPGPVPARAGRPGQLTALPNGLLKHQHAPRRASWDSARARFGRQQDQVGEHDFLGLLGASARSCRNRSPRSAPGDAAAGSCLA
jgi:hypothetical protein